MLPLGSGSKLTTAANGSTVAYGVAPVLCMIKRPLKPDPAPPASPMPILCGDGSGATATDLRVATFVSVAKIPDEAASATLVQTIGQYPKLGDLLNTPPITTAGSAGVTGTLQVVTNPNGGGAGVPVSVWTRVDVEKTGTTNTCYADEFFRYTQGAQKVCSAQSTPGAANTPCAYEGTIRCDSCRCDATGSPSTLSFDNSGGKQEEGIDILDVETNTDSQTAYHAAGSGGGTHVGTNYNVRSDALSYPTCEFPPDLFKYVFGTAVWEDKNKDCFGEAKLPAALYVADNGASATIGADEAYLYKNADKIINAGYPALLKTGQAGTTALLGTKSAPFTSGKIIWCQQKAANDCDIGSGVQLGTPSEPVVLILDGPVSIQGTIFGFVFIRDTGTTLDPKTGSTFTGKCPNDCMVTMNAGAAIYGALVIQGQMTAKGTAAVIYDATVLGNIGGDNNLIYATLPGAWNDQRSY
jgi:hypothetical protein